MREREADNIEPARRQLEKYWPHVVDSEDGRMGLEAKGCRWPLKAGRRKKTDYSLALPERNASD